MRILVAGAFDDVRSRHVRFLEEAAKLGDVHVLLWSDDSVRSVGGKNPKFPYNERSYLLQAIRFVGQVTMVARQVNYNTLPQSNAMPGDVWVVDEAGDNAEKRAFSSAYGLRYHIVRDHDMVGFPGLSQSASSGQGRKKAVATGCFDWLHSGHVRFFEEVSELGDLYVVVGRDANVRLLKGAGHPLFGQEERRYMVQSVRYVKQALVSTGHGWMDAEPEIGIIRPDMYVVNEDGDKPEKREFCRTHGLQYVVLARAPKEGLPRRQSTDLRGF
jgi:cytidyltransferase-like protein